MAEHVIISVRQNEYQSMFILENSCWIFYKSIIHEKKPIYSLVNLNLHDLQGFQILYQNLSL